MDIVEHPIDFLGNEVLPGNILIEQSGMAGEKYSYTIWEMPPGFCYQGLWYYNNGTRGLFHWANPKNAVVVTQEDVPNEFMDYFKHGMWNFESPIQIGEDSAKRIIEASNWERWKRQIELR